MKSVLITALATLCLLANRTLARKNVEDMSLEEILDTFQDPNNFFINEEKPIVENSDENIVNAANENTQPQPQEQKEIPVSESVPENNEKSNAKAYLFGGVGVTSVALVALFGVKSHRKSEDIEEITRELLFENEEDISMPDKVKKPNTVNRLSRSLSLSLSNITDLFDEVTPTVSTSMYSDNYSLAKNRAYKCQFEWIPRNSDEIALNPGDLVCVKESYDDGYSLGRNLYSRNDGIFPTCCLAAPEEKKMGSELIKEGEFQSILRRSSSKSKPKLSRKASMVSVSVPNWM